MRSAQYKLTVFLVVFAGVSVIGNTVRSEQVAEEIHLAIKEMDGSLASPITKFGLEATVRRFWQARTEISPNGYERDSEFQEGFQPIFDKFKVRLGQGNFEEITAKIDTEMVDAMVVSYNKSVERGYLQFVDSIIKKEEEEGNFFPQYFTRKAITRAQISFFLILFDAANEEEKEKTKKLTYIWPLCY